MAKSVRFESVDAPEQIVETNTTKVPFDIGKPPGDTITLSSGPPAYEAHLKRANRATRTMQYLWTGEIVANGDGPRVLGLGSSGTFAFLPQMMKGPQALLNVRVTAINANGKAYSFDKVYQLNQ